MNHFKNYSLVLLLLFPLGVLFSQSTASERLAQINAFEEIDEHVRDCPKEIKSDPDQLVEYFNQVAETDLEKARSIYVWLADNISYNVKAIDKNKTEVSFLDMYYTQKADWHRQIFSFIEKYLELNFEEVK